MGPWIDRTTLITNAQLFVRTYGAFFRGNAKRISSLVEISVYNSIVAFYKREKFKVTGKNLGPGKSFRYKLTASGLTENYSFFVAKKDDVEVHLLHNISIQSAHDDHIYFTADVVVATHPGATTKRLKSNRRHSYVANKDLVTFAEVKHLNPFPEVLFNFTGLVLEFRPDLIDNGCSISQTGHQLCPIIAFTGVASDHSERIRDSLGSRYGINIVFGTSKSFGGIDGFDELNRYERVTRPTTKTVTDD